MLHRPLLQSFFWLCTFYSSIAHLCQVSIDLICFSLLKFEVFWILASSLVIVLKLFLIYGYSEPQCPYKVCSYIKTKCAEKQRAFNYMMIFNDSVSKFYQCSIHGICRGTSMLFSTCFGQKSAKNYILRNLKKHISKNKIYFSLKKESNVSNISDTFKLDFVTQIIYCIIHRCLYSLFML